MKIIIKVSLLIILFNLAYGYTQLFDILEKDDESLKSKENGNNFQTPNNLEDSKMKVFKEIKDNVESIINSNSNLKINEPKNIDFKKNDNDNNSSLFKFITNKKPIKEETLSNSLFQKDNVKKIFFIFL